MKITVINGNMRSGSTWHCMDILRQELSKYGEVESTEFFLPRDMPNFCSGCFMCFLKGEEWCPHSESVKPIADALFASDLIILTSPVYALDVTGQMKALLDHLCYFWLVHRPDARMFNKIGLIVSTTAGGGLGHTAKTLRNSLNFWGVKKSYALKFPVAAAKWSEVTEKKQRKIKREAAKTAKKIAAAVQNPDRLPNPIFRSFVFNLTKRYIKKGKWNEHDAEYWRAQGWLDGKKPF